ncbi:sensor histidine kinase [Krasilnikoviella flava]|uniref:histidine kinase n=1 Tax=Krasilnikoviella flava TaxID=526729 RepID=A0A1T5IR88_9MICO|nr:histidine kinase [Krasilnikoviella flava]SKC41697.1 Signal transduction histidine kinase [Krasilnikoviella flava]
MTSTDAPGRRVDAAPALTSRAGLLRAPVDPATGRAVAQLAVGTVWLASAGVVVWVLVVVSSALVPALGLGLLALGVTLSAARWFAALERARLAAQTGVVVPGPRPAAAGLPRSWASLRARLRDGRAWAAAGYAFVAMPVSAAFLAAVVGLVAGAIAFVVVMARGGIGALGGEAGLAWPVALVGGALGAALLLWLGAAVAQAGTTLVLWLAQACLGPSAADLARERARDAEHAATAARERAVVLSETRSQAVAAADAERRRIERDLHDGAQQRLVALGVELGVARRLAERDPAASAAALEHAHDEVKATLAELRDLVRGIHPAVLSDRGLDAALSALAARSPVPVRVESSPDVSRAGSAAQAAAYFVVAEALTNVAKHAAADTVRVRADVTDDGARLRVVVEDDGRGGAEPSPGSGLAGLRGRVAALDGAFALDSPPGAGTRLTVEVPCAS